ncbi:MAG: gas vesicle protein GvpG [Deltaproteobacteria bacterium]|nr:gas vesicle protein GvpG [Deltaproteobacteria bacterium]
MLLIDDLLLLPFKGFIGIFKKIHEMAEKEFSDEDYIRERLMELQLKFELDEISEEEYTRQEKELMARLDAIRKAKEEEV